MTICMCTNPEHCRLPVANRPGCSHLPDANLAEKLCLHSPDFDAASRTSAWCHSLYKALRASDKLGGNPLKVLGDALAQYTAAVTEQTERLAELERAKAFPAVVVTSTTYAQTAMQALEQADRERLAFDRVRLSVRIVRLLKKLDNGEALTVAQIEDKLFGAKCFRQIGGEPVAAVDKVCRQLAAFGVLCVQVDKDGANAYREARDEPQPQVAPVAVPAAAVAPLDPLWVTEHILRVLNKAKVTMTMREIQNYLPAPIDLSYVHDTLKLMEAEGRVHNSGGYWYTKSPTEQPQAAGFTSAGAINLKIASAITNLLSSKHCSSSLTVPAIRNYLANKGIDYIFDEYHIRNVIASLTEQQVLKRACSHPDSYSLMVNF